MTNAQILYPRTLQALLDDPRLPEEIDKYNTEKNLEVLKNFTSNKPMTFYTRGGKLVIDKSAKTGLLRTTPEDAPFPSDTKIQFEKFEKAVMQEPYQIALFLAKQNLFEVNSDENSVNELEMDNSNAKEEEL